MGEFGFSLAPVEAIGQFWAWEWHGQTLWFRASLGWIGQNGSDGGWTVVRGAKHGGHVSRLVLGKHLKLGR